MHVQCCGLQRLDGRAPTRHFPGGVRLLVRRLFALPVV